MIASFCISSSCKCAYHRSVLVVVTIALVNSPDENSRERMTFSPAMEEEMPIEPISDISIDHINDLMFGGG
jgi:hypothetical protein